MLVKQGRRQGFRYSGGFWAPVVNADKAAYRAGWDAVFGGKDSDDPPASDSGDDEPPGEDDGEVRDD